MEMKDSESMATVTRKSVLDRLLEPLGRCLTVQSARKLMNLRADPVAQARIAVLAEKCNEGRLSPKERAEYELYVSAGTFIATLQAKARGLLAEHANS